MNGGRVVQPSPCTSKGEIHLPNGTVPPANKRNIARLPGEDRADTRTCCALNGVDFTCTREAVNLSRELVFWKTPSAVKFLVA